MSEVNDIYIISKGRPNCTTARTISKERYPGDWFIVCGNNDEVLDRYIENWGEHVIVFGWYDEVKRTDTLDNFGFDKMPSGAVPARNATMEIAKKRGCRRHWQFDDDYNGFYRVTDGTMRKHRMGGAELYETLEELALFADRCGMQNIGISLGTIESHPNKKYSFGRRVFNAHNLPCDERIFQRWRGRMNDDLINAIEIYRNGGYEMQVRYANLTMAPSQSESGGLTDIYRDEGTVRKTAYPVLLAPNAVKLSTRFGRYHHTCNWAKLTPMLIREEHSHHGCA